MAVRLAGEGYGVVLVGRREGKLEETAAQIRAHAGTARVAAANVTKEGEVEVVVARAVDGFGRVDALVNCAGSAAGVPLAKLTAAQWREVVESNLSAAFYMMPGGVAGHAEAI